MIRSSNIRRDQRGVAAIEMAFALPILLLFVFGIFQFGVILQANAGIQHALGEGARMATLHPQPADSAIEAKMANSVFGLNVGTFSAPTVTTPTSTVCTNCRLLTVNYTVTPNFVFFEGPAITLVRTKQVYVDKPVT
jgi:Flp pilus assembly protein TadG